MKINELKLKNQSEIETFFTYKSNHIYDLQYRKFNPDQNERVTKKRKSKELFIH